MLPAGEVRICLACGTPDMRRGIYSLAAQVQTVLQHDPYSGAIFIFRGRRGDLIKCLLYDRQDMCLYGEEAGPWPLYLATGKGWCGLADHGPVLASIGATLPGPRGQRL
ncbi:MAG: IS66 family insertion sequence element accessory protein TnpB [Acetobacteraceae bacterium]|nr:IS66 family insertion sequence element accessory protein TnpB [Acetobacteraceae bacterium]